MPKKLLKTGDLKNSENSKAKPIDENKKIAFLFDATGSRNPTWEDAQKWQEEIINEFASAGAEVGIVVHRGGKVEDIGWFTNGHDAKSAMSEITCKTGLTQIAHGLKVCTEGPDNKPPKAIIMIGDAYETEKEDYNKVANYLKKKNIPVHAFFEDGGTTRGKDVYDKISKITGGLFKELGPDMQLKDLVRTLFVYSIKGEKDFVELIDQGDTTALALKEAGLMTKSNTDENSKKRIVRRKIKPPN